jgi:hypothetical protein
MKKEVHQGDVGEKFLLLVQAVSFLPNAYKGEL